MTAGGAVVNKILIMAIILAGFARNSGQSRHLEAISGQLSPWYDLESPGAYLKTDQPRIPEIDSDSSHSYAFLITS
jgi:hypothetical protein